jgi:hypothetical protein
MELGEVRAAAGRVAEGRSEELPFRMAELGESLDRALSDSAALSTVARRVYETAERLDCRRVAGASPLGERLAGAAVAIAQNGLGVYAPGESVKDVLVVDGLLATGTGVAWAAQSLKQQGVERTPVAVVLSVGPTAIPAGPDEVVILLD